MAFTAGFKRTGIFAATMVLSLAATTTANAARTDPAAPGVDWSGCTLLGVNLERTNKRGANLHNAILDGTQFTKAYMIYSDLTGASIRAVRDTTHSQRRYKVAAP